MTLDKNHLHIIGIYALICIIPCALLYFWFQAGVFTLTLIFISLLKDIRGRQGWVRGLLLKHCGKNIISWFPERIPSEAKKSPPSVPSVIVALPYTIHQYKKWPFVTVIFICVTIAFLPAIANLLSSAVYAWVAGSLLLLTLICFGLPNPQEELHPKSISHHNTIQQIWNKKSRNRKLAILLYADGINGGGLSTFLQNYEDFIPPDKSFLVSIEEAQELEYALPSSFLGTCTPSEFVQALLPSSTISVPSTFQSTYTHGWSSIIVRTPFSEESIEKVLSLIDTQQ